MNRVRTDFLQKVSAYFESLQIDVKGKNICVALSGGADSVSLLRAMILLSDKFGFTVSACHFNHMIRGDEADRDEAFCKELCRGLGVKIYSGRDDVPAYSKLYKVSLEDGARQCRYAFFKRVCSKDSVDYCATAHNMNDDAETLLLNLIRGSGSNGASAISPVLNNILRPLLKVSRSEIESFLVSIQQKYVTDSTNQSIEYTRNRIRNVIFPEIQKINPSATDAFSRYIDSCRVDRAYFDQIVEVNIDSDLRSLHKAIRDRVVFRKYRDFTGTLPGNNIISAIESALFSKSRSILSLNDEFEAIVEDGSVNFYRRSEITAYAFDEENLKLGENTVFAEKVQIKFSESKLCNYKNFNKIAITDLLSFDNIVGELMVRNRRVGDKITIHGVNKSLKKLFIDKKIPKEYRDLIPIISDEKGIIYVPFVGIADRAFPRECKKSMYIHTCFNTIDKERWVSAYEK